MSSMLACAHVAESSSAPFNVRLGQIADYAVLVLFDDDGWPMQCNLPFVDNHIEVRSHAVSFALGIESCGDAMRGEHVDGRPVAARTQKTVDLVLGVAMPEDSHLSDAVGVYVHTWALSACFFACGYIQCFKQVGVMQESWTLEWGRSPLLVKCSRA